MKIFAIRDESANAQKDLAYLLYYEREQRFYIELLEETDPWEVPLLLDSFRRRGEMTINSYWSKLWVQQRIIPTDRQNISQILRDNQIEEYDEYKLLILAMGRCAQDDYYLVPIDNKDLPSEVKARYATKIEDVLPLNNFSVLVFFRDGLIKKCDLEKYFQKKTEFQILLKEPKYFAQVQMQTGGYGVSWDIGMNISDAELYAMGRKVPLTADDFQSFVQQRVINVSEAAEYLGCSRQNITDLTRRGKLHPIKATEKNTLYLKSEILKRNWQ